MKITDAFDNTYWEEQISKNERHLKIDLNYLVNASYLTNDEKRDLLNRMHASLTYICETIDSDIAVLNKITDTDEKPRTIRSFNMNDKNILYTDIYPLTIVKDRYNGVYSGGKYIAWNCQPWNIPEETQEDDISANRIWMDTHDFSAAFPKYGVGETIKEAVNNLFDLIHGERMG